MLLSLHEQGMGKYENSHHRLFGNISILLFLNLDFKWGKVHHFLRKAVWTGIWSRSMRYNDFGIKCGRWITSLCFTWTFLLFVCLLAWTIGRENTESLVLQICLISSKERVPHKWKRLSYFTFFSHFGLKYKRNIT